MGLEIFDVIQTNNIYLMSSFSKIVIKLCQSNSKKENSEMKEQLRSSMDSK